MGAISLREDGYDDAPSNPKLEPARRRQLVEDLMKTRPALRTKTTGRPRFVPEWKRRGQSKRLGNMAQSGRPTAHLTTTGISQEHSLCRLVRKCRFPGWLKTMDTLENPSVRTGMSRN
jgi:hypothetical protein